MAENKNIKYDNTTDNKKNNKNGQKIMNRNGQKQINFFPKKSLLLILTISFDFFIL